jgi:hypothetical protein
VERLRTEGVAKQKELEQLRVRAKELATALETKEGEKQHWQAGQQRGAARWCGL